MALLVSNPGARRPILEEPLTFRSVCVQLPFPDALGATQRHPFLRVCSQGLGGTLRDQIQLNFCGHGEGHGDNLALNAVAKLPVALRGGGTNLFLGSQREHFHTFQQTSAQARQFADNQGITRLRLVEHGGDLLLAPGDPARLFLFNELDVAQMGVVGQFQDVHTIVVWKLDRLGRSFRNLIDTVLDLEKRGVNFRSTTENVDTSTSGGKFIFSLFG